MKSLCFPLIALTLATTPVSAQHVHHSADHSHHNSHSQAAPKPAKKSAGKPGKLDEAFARYDTNSDGFVTHDELPAGHALHEHFDMSDRNKDGKLNKQEFGIALKMIS